jgi:hypothetical protein
VASNAREHKQLKYVEDIFMAAYQYMILSLILW